MTIPITSRYKTLYLIGLLITYLYLQVVHFPILYNGIPSTRRSKDLVVFQHNQQTTDALLRRETTNQTAGVIHPYQDNHSKTKSIPEVHGERQIFNGTALRTSPHWPSWTQKFPFYPHDDEISDRTKRVCFVHIGKTAGTTLACNLGFQYPVCGSDNIVVLPGALAQHTTNIMHTRFDTCHHHAYGDDDIRSNRKNNETDAIYLFAIRDPLSRLQSWFTYERPKDKKSPQYQQKKPLFINCQFQTLNQLGLALIPNNTSTIGTYTSESINTCAQIAWNAVTGKTGYSRHNKYNYEYYYNMVMRDHMQHRHDNDLNNKTTKQQNTGTVTISNSNEARKIRIVVARTEHLADDWNALEVLLFRGPADGEFSLDATFFEPINTSIKKEEDDRRLLTVTSRRNLCWALCREIAIYKELLRRAENLTPYQVEESLAELALQCPNEAKEDKCSLSGRMLLH